MKFIKVIIIVFIFIIVLLILNDIILGDYQEMCRDMEIVFPITAKMEYKDTHGGFRNEGETLAKVYLNAEQTEKIIEKIQKNPNWKKTPITEFLEKRITENTIEEDMAVPKIINGYWICKDRHLDAVDIYNEMEIFSQKRYSDNYSVGVLDVYKNILYFYKVDT